MRRTRTALLSVAGIVAAILPTGIPSAAAATAAPGGPQACVSSPKTDGGQAARVRDVVRQASQDLHLNSVVFKVDSGDRDVVTGAVGESMTGVPADPAMHFRSGSVAIEYMATVLLQLVDEGKVSLDDPVSRWLPTLPHASEITLRMLGSSTSGLHDYVTDKKFLAELEAAPFRHWSFSDVVDIATAPPLWYKPGTSWSYSHANFQILGVALEKITGTPLDRLLAERITTPLALKGTHNAFTPEIPAPALHAFTSERGVYEESTYWNPSWTTAAGAVLTSDICDLARSARAIGSGELLSPQGLRTLLDPGTVGLGGKTGTCPADVCLKNTAAQHFGFGVLVVHDWILQNPSFSGYAAVQAYLPARKLSIAVTTTQGPKATEQNPGQTIAARIAQVLAPDHPLTTH
ncbi:serine hydrolase domain-containing protein [Streptomyces sp. NPDC051578]|uniref:serine hydrolase domain-containing protein n=1 Tax=Streptomyces sp. NPDC051578 TaxID=3365662 RepID=UPI0037B5B1E3